MSDVHGQSDGASRWEKDSLGEIEVPAGAYYGAQTVRAVGNFPISGERMPGEFIRAHVMVKKAAAVAHARVPTRILELLADLPVSRSADWVEFVNEP